MRVRNYVKFFVSQRRESKIFGLKLESGIRKNIVVRTRFDRTMDKSTSSSGDSKSPGEWTETDFTIFANTSPMREYLLEDRFGESLGRWEDGTATQDDILRIFETPDLAQMAKTAMLCGSDFWEGGENGGRYNKITKAEIESKEWNWIKTAFLDCIGPSGPGLGPSAESAFMAATKDIEPSVKTRSDAVETAKAALNGVYGPKAKAEFRDAIYSACRGK